MKPEAAARLPAPADGLQANVCKSPHCPHFGIPPDPSSDARPPPRHGYGPTAFYDGRYAIGAAGRTQTPPLLECLGCGETPPLKSNRAIATERRRLEEAGATSVQPPGCPNPNCRQHGRAPAAHPEGYARYGRTASGAQRLLCKSCEHAFVPERRPSGMPRQPWLYDEYRALGALMAHAPISRVLARSGLGAGRLYQLLGRAHRAVRSFRQGRADALAGAAAVRRPFPLRLACDRQVYGVNWSDRSDRRKVMLYGIATADATTGYVFAMDANYDPDADPDALASEAEAADDAALPACYRRGDTARVWLPGERDRRLAPGRAPDVGAAAGTPTERRYRRAAARTDVESPETAGRAPARGALVREDIGIYAHFLRVRRLLDSPRKTVLCFEQESAMRAACMAAWGEDIRAGRCEAYYVRIAKERTAREKREIGAAARRRVAGVMAETGCDAVEARRRLVRGALAGMESRGPWRDRWLRHPCPSAFEPEKEVCRLTRRDPDEDEARNEDAVNGYAFASLGAVDRHFMKIRYALNLLDRARSSGQRHGRRGGPEPLTDDKWDVYHPYNPAHVQMLLDLLRFDRNWCAPGQDGKTPAMRLGIADRPLELAEALEAAGEDLSLAREARELLEAQRRGRKARGQSSVRAAAGSGGITMGM